MNFRYLTGAVRDYDALTPVLQSRVRKQLDLLVQNIRHPSLRAKKFDKANDIWQARVNNDYRFYFSIQGDTYIILAITRHPK